MDNMNFLIEREKLKDVISDCCNNQSITSALPLDNYCASFIYPIELARLTLWEKANQAQQFDINELLNAAEAIMLLSKVKNEYPSLLTGAKFDFSIHSIGFLQEFCDVIRDKVIDTKAKSFKREDEQLESIIFSHPLLSIFKTDFYSLTNALALLLSKYWAECLLRIRKNGRCVMVNGTPTLMWDNEVIVEIPKSKNNSVPILLRLADINSITYEKPLNLVQGIQGRFHSSDPFESIKLNTLFIEAVINKKSTGTPADGHLVLEIMSKLAKWY